jgi:hypothetical protein
VTTPRVPWATLVLLTAVLAVLVAVVVVVDPPWSSAAESSEEDLAGPSGLDRAMLARTRAVHSGEISAALRRATAPSVAPLTGVEVPGAELATLEQRPAAVVKIPNNAEARPHTGIEDADVVYEQETEGGTTRFAAVFHSRIPDVVGNVRSARFVDVALVKPYGAVFVYAGARGEVLDRIEAADLVTVGAGGPGYFTDTPRRQAPHHLYTRLAEAIAERPEAEPVPPSPWRFEAEPPQDGHPVEDGLRIVMSPIAATGWEYDEDAGVFRRLQNDRPHEVTGAGRIGAANVVLLDVEVPERDSHGAPVYDLDGDGAALLLRDGAAYEIAWAKDGDAGPLELVDGDHRAALRPGPTWVMLTYDGTIEAVLDDLTEQP